MSLEMILDREHFLNDEAVKWSLDHWSAYLNGTERVKNTAMALYNMDVILRAYGLNGIVTPEQVLENLSKINA